MTFAGLINNIIDILRSFIWLAMGLGLLYFMWGIVLYLTAYDDESAHAKSVHTILYGLASFFVMVAVWGLVEMISAAVLGGGRIGIPQF